MPRELGTLRSDAAGARQNRAGILRSGRARAGLSPGIRRTF